MTTVRQLLPVEAAYVGAMLDAEGTVTYRHQRVSYQGIKLSLSDATLVPLEKDGG